MAPKKKADNPLGPSARVISVFGPFNARTLVELSTEKAIELFDGPLAAHGRTSVADAVLRDIDAIKALSPALAESGLAATAERLAIELDHPGNSATSKGQCAKALTDILAELRALAPEKKEQDGLDEIAERRSKRRERKTAAQG